MKAAASGIFKTTGRPHSLAGDERSLEVDLEKNNLVAHQSLFNPATVIHTFDKAVKNKAEVQEPHLLLLRLLSYPRACDHCH